MPQLTEENKQKGLNVLSAWTVLEVLSPSPFDREAYESNNADSNKGSKTNESNNAHNHKGSVKDIHSSSNDSQAPWEKTIKRRSSSEIKYFYQIVPGTILLKNAVDSLIKEYGTEEGEEYSSKDVKGEALIAVITVDENGLLIDKSQAVHIASFAWGLPRALKGELKRLHKWPDAEKDLEERVCSRNCVKGGVRKELN